VPPNPTDFGNSCSYFCEHGVNCGGRSLASHGSAHAHAITIASSDTPQKKYNVRADHSMAGSSHRCSHVLESSRGLRRTRTWPLVSQPNSSRMCKQLLTNMPNLKKAVLAQIDHSSSVFSHGHLFFRYMTLGGLFLDGLELGALLLQMILMTQVHSIPGIFHFEKQLKCALSILRGTVFSLDRN
jgi:hypothetical protein